MKSNGGALYGAVWFAGFIMGIAIVMLNMHLADYNRIFREQSGVLYMYKGEIDNSPKLYLLEVTETNAIEVKLTQELEEKIEELNELEVKLKRLRTEE